LVGVAVNVTDVPEQIVVALALTLTVGVTSAFTVVAMLLLLAVAVVTQVAFDVITHVTASPFTKLLLLYVALLVPTLAPFNRHW
jgi:hypothetical protein